MSQVIFDEALDFRERIKAKSKHRCGYCLADAKRVYGPMELDHIIPRSKKSLFPNLDVEDETNRWLSCRYCNLFKKAQYEGIDPVTNQTMPLFNPQTQTWREHFTWDNDKAKINGITAIGRVTVIALRLNNEDAHAVRLDWVDLGWYPPDD